MMHCEMEWCFSSRICNIYHQQFWANLQQMMIGRSSFYIYWSRIVFNFFKYHKILQSWWDGGFFRSFIGSKEKISNFSGFPRRHKIECGKVSKDISAKYKKKTKLLERESSSALVISLFRNKSLVLDEKFQQNASKFAIFLAYENPSFSIFILYSQKIWQILKLFTRSFHQA